MLSYYAKAIIGAVVSGLAYLMSVIAPASHIQDITLLQWLGFAVAILGTFGSVAVVTNGVKPGASVPADPVVDAPAAPPSVYPSAAVAAAEVTAPEVIVPEVAPAETPAQ
jgi:hypothetical protein